MRDRSILSLTCRLLAMLLLLGQWLVGPARAFAALDAAVSLDFAGAICHAGSEGPTAPSAPNEHKTDCALCIVCRELGAAAVLPVPLSGAAAPPVLMAVQPIKPPPRAPPTAFRLAAAYPTGPPTLA